MKSRFREEKVFKDPVHKYIYVQEQTIWDLINTKEFQRLRRIRQLGTSYMTFHGAEHSRFSHSLGVYEITRKIISQFERNFYTDWPQQERLVSLCAALLHDIGHAPFSHSMESLFVNGHEQWSCQVILGDTDINDVLRRIGDEFPEKVAAAISKTYDQKMVTSLISSQLDADRMDYLLRDAYFTGVNYGTFDLERILRLLRPYDGKIVVKESGMHAVEDYLMSRYQMHWQVYFHPVTRSSEIILRKIFKRAEALFHSGYSFQFLFPPLPSLFHHTLGLDEYLSLDESFVQMTLMQWSYEKDVILSDLCCRFMERKLFKYVILHSLETDFIETIRGQLEREGLDCSYYLEIDSPTDLPYDIYQAKESLEKEPILLLCEGDRLEEISMRSEIVHSISGIRGGTYHLYYPADRIDIKSLF